MTKKPATRQVVLVGHCGPDSWMLRRAVKRALPEVKVISANDEASLKQAATRGALLLVNRVLDGAFVSDNGVDLIRRITQQTDAPALMLVSNLAEAQSEAEHAGAHPGFGKNDMRAPETADRMRAAIENRKTEQ